MPEWLHPTWLMALVPIAAMVIWRWRRGAGGRGVRARLADLLRATVLALLAIVLAGPIARISVPGTDVVFALDISASVSSASRARALAFINRAIAQAPSDVRHGVVAFGADAATERYLRAGLTPLAELSVALDREGTDIGLGIELGISTFVDSGARRIVLLSDGQDNLGDVDGAVAMARALGVTVHAIALDDDYGNDELRVSHLGVPAFVRVNEPFAARVIIEVGAVTGAQLVLSHNGVVIEERTLTLKPGRNTVALPQQIGEAGLHEFEAIVNLPTDAVQQNNRYQAFVRVKGEPRVLHVLGEADAADSPFISALRAQNLRVDDLPATALPEPLNRLVDYDLIVLNDVSGFDLSEPKMETLERYVRDAGGGLVMLGGLRSFGAGGYFSTPVERTLPVDMDVRTEVKIPSLAVIILLDKSGSMATVSGGREKLDIAKRAALAAVEVLSPLDTVGVLAFDAGFEWVVPPTEVGNRRAIAARLRSLQSGGGTDLLIGLAEAYRLMAQQPARVKHLIVLSDGLSDNDSGHESLAARIVDDKITISTVAFGGDADRSLLERIAAIGKGRHYYTADIRNVPRIFTSETLVVARSLVAEGDFLPTLVYPGEPLEGLEPSAIPAVQGYQRTWAKPAAQVLLSAGDGDPLLATWRYGLGRSVAFTTDVNGRWSNEWSQWSDYSRFAAQLARWSMRRSGGEQLSANFTWRNKSARMTVDALDVDDRFINGLSLTAAVSGPRGERKPVTLRQIAPGRYEAPFELDGPGRYFLSVAAQQDGDSLSPQTFGLAIPYSPEYATSGVDVAALQRIASATGGLVLKMSAATESLVVAPHPQARPIGERLWWPLVLAALVLVVVELMVRKLPMPQRLKHWFEWVDKAPQASEPGYDELVAGIARARDAHIAQLRDGAYYRADDPAVRARLYVSGRADNNVDKRD